VTTSIISRMLVRLQESSNELLRAVTISSDTGEPAMLRRTIFHPFNFCLVALLAGGLMSSLQARAQSQRYVVVDQDAVGPAGTDMNSILIFLQTPGVKVLGITVVTGDGWRDEEVAHTLRLLELVGRADVPVHAGAAFPLVRTPEWTHTWEQLYGKVPYQGAWNSYRGSHTPFEVPPLKEGSPSTKVAEEDAAHFLVRMVHEHPHEVTIYAAGPMTNIALAIALDSNFASLAKELVIMGGSLRPQGDDPEFLDNPRREFNLWFDPEAASITLRARWPKIEVTSVDVSIETHLTTEMVQQLGRCNGVAAQYISRFTQKPGDYLWDELAAAAWVKPELITQERFNYIDVSTDKGPSYGDTLTWSDNTKPTYELQKAHIQIHVDFPVFQKFFVDLMCAPTPQAHNPMLEQQKQPE
jgi:purine nucleosidase